MVESVSILDLLHTRNPYEGFCADQWPSDGAGWHGTHPFLTEMVEKYKPAIAVEVGTWKGQSAITVGTAMKEYGGKLICVDTWLGSDEFWMDKSDRERYLALQLVNGYPAVYYEFLANVCRAGLQGTIIPFPQTSIAAARILKNHGIQPNMVYIDASHHEQDVLADMNSWWHVLTDDGVMFGDDYEDWDGVTKAVFQFISHGDLSKVSTQDCFWVIEK